MQTAILPGIDVPFPDEISRGKRMTYQIIMQGHDGMVIASDQRELKIPGPDEGQGAVNNMVTKILTDPTGQFAWCFAGAKPSLLAASFLQREFENGTQGRDISRVLRDCGDRGWDAGASGPSDSSVVLVDGRTKSILRATLAYQSTIVLPVNEGLCFSGQHYSKASFVPSRFYSKTMSVEQLTRLAAYAILVAGEIDPLLIGGLDIAVYRDSNGRFEFLSSDSCTAEMKRLDAEILSVFKRHKEKGDSV
jgi:hypothetical protein